MYSTACSILSQGCQQHYLRLHMCQIFQPPAAHYHHHVFPNRASLCLSTVPTSGHISTYGLLPTQTRVVQSLASSEILGRHMQRIGSFRTFCRTFKVLGDLMNKTWEVKNREVKIAEICSDFPFQHTMRLAVILLHFRNRSLDV